MKLKQLIFAVLATMTVSMVSAQTPDSTDPDAKYATQMLKVGEDIPDMIVDSAQNIRLSDMKGVFVVLHFWASWCPDCRRDIPKMMELQKKYEDKDVFFVHLSYDTNQQAWQKYMQQVGMTSFNVCSLEKMREAQSARTYHIDWIPAMYLIAPDGKIILSTVVADKLEKALNNRYKKNMGIRKYLRFPENKVYSLPQYPGGMNALLTFLKNNLHYPVKAQKYGIEAKVRVKFTVSKEGEIIEPSISQTQLTGADSKKYNKLTPEEQEAVKKEALGLLEEEALRIVRKLKKWIPAKKFNYGNVDNDMLLPVTFKLQ